MPDEAKGAQHSVEPWLPKVGLVLSSMSPLFILWGIRGSSLLSTGVFSAICATLVIVSNLYLVSMVARSRAMVGKRTIEVGQADDRRQDVISYLFAMLLPFYTVDLDSWRNFAATVAAFIIVVILFTSLDLHYLNLWIAVFGYHCYQVTAPTMPNSTPRGDRVMLITKRLALHPGERITCHPVSALVVLEE